MLLQQVRLKVQHVSVGTILIAVIALVYIANYSFLIGGYIESICHRDGSGLFICTYNLVNGNWSEAVIAGELLGLKTTLNEFVAYPALASLKMGLCQKDQINYFLQLMWFC